PPKKTCEGCLGMTIVELAAMAWTTATSSTSVWTSRLMLFRKTSSTLTPANATPPSNVIQGPGAFVQSHAVSDARSWAGMEMVELTVCCARALGTPTKVAISVARMHATNLRAKMFLFTVAPHSVCRVWVLTGFPVGTRFLANPILASCVRQQLVSRDALRRPETA